MVETPETLAWAAGFFDGEGCIGYPRTIRNPINGRRYSQLRVSIVQVDQAPLLFLKSVFGGCVEQVKGKGRGQPHGRWVITCKKARDFLNAIHPYLREKHKHPWFSRPPEIPVRRQNPVGQLQSLLRLLADGPRDRKQVSEFLEVGLQQASTLLNRAYGRGLTVKLPGSMWGLRAADWRIGPASMSC